VKPSRIVGIVLLAAAVSSAVYGAAANFTLTSTDSGAADTGVTSCDTDGLTASFGPVAWEPLIGAYEMTTVTVSGIAQPGCGNAQLRIQLTGAGGAALAEKVSNDINGFVSVSPSFAGDNVSVESVTGIHVALIGP
jgi:hypothetical protein